MKKIFFSTKRPAAILLPGICLFLLSIPTIRAIGQEVVTIPDTQKERPLQYMASMSLGMMPGGNDLITFVPLSMQVSQGILYNKGMYTGITLGVETFEPNLLTLGFEPRFYLGKGWVRPWIGTKAGYGFTLDNNVTIGWTSMEYRGGFAFSAGGGFSYDISDKVSTWFSIGYRYQEIHGTTNAGETNEQYNQIKYNRFELRIGVAVH